VVEIGNFVYMKRIVVDLDGTLVKTDMLYESFIMNLSRNPLILFLCFYWLIVGGKVLLKSKLADRYEFEPEFLPYNEELLNYLKKEKNNGSALYLATATHESIANKISAYLGLFIDVFATNNVINLSGKNKAEFLNKKFGTGNYLYVGNSSVDLPIWLSAGAAVCVNISSKVKNKLLDYKKIQVEHVFIEKKSRIKSVLLMLRVHQWCKNLLLFVPLVTANMIGQINAWLLLIAAFFSFSFLASFVYILNDLLDLDSDRKHITKCRRPLASGNVSIITGLVSLPLLFATSVFVAFLISERFVGCLFIYFVVTTLYSFVLKRIVIIDCLTLSFLYTFRMLSGIVILSVPISLWLVSFSGFFFLSLAFIKRIAELKNLERQGRDKSDKRGYKLCDLPMLSQIGVASGYTSTLIFALYVNSGRISLFNHPTFVYFCGPVLVYWITYMFFKTNRGEMDEDPVIFAVRNKHSLFSGLLFCTLFVIGVL